MTGTDGHTNETVHPTTTVDVGAVGALHWTKVCPFLLFHINSYKRCRAGGRKRRRSMSPYDRERYDPRPRYSDDYGLPFTLFLSCPRVSHSSCLDAHSRHGYTSPRRHAAPYGSSRRPPPDPHTLEYPASLKQYAEWFRYHYPTQAAEEDQADKAAEHQAGDGSKPRNGIKSKWEKYKKDFAATQVSVLLFICPMPSCCRPQSCVVFTVVSFLFYCRKQLLNSVVVL